MTSQILSKYVLVAAWTGGAALLLWTNVTFEMFHRFVFPGTIWLTARGVTRMRNVTMLIETILGST